MEKVTFALAQEGGVEWWYPKDKPDLTPEEAVAVGINMAAKGLSDIATALSSIAMALDRIADSQET